MAHSCEPFVWKRVRAIYYTNTKMRSLGLSIFNFQFWVCFMDFSHIVKTTHNAIHVCEHRETWNPHIDAMSMNCSPHCKHITKTIPASPRIPCGRCVAVRSWTCRLGWSCSRRWMRRSAPNSWCRRSSAKSRGPTSPLRGQSGPALPVIAPPSLVPLLTAVEGRAGPTSDLYVLPSRSQ